MRLLFYLLLAFGIGLLLSVLRALRREHIRVEHSVSWFVAAASFIVLSVLPLALARTGNPLFQNLHDVADILLFLAITVAIGTAYRLSRIVSGLKDMNITLTQRLAILEFKVRQLDEKEKD